MLATLRSRAVPILWGVGGAVAAWLLLTLGSVAWQDHQKVQQLYQLELVRSQRASQTQAQGK